MKKCLHVKEVAIAIGEAEFSVLVLNGGYPLEVATGVKGVYHFM